MVEPIRRADVRVLTITYALAWLSGPCAYDVNRHGGGCWSTGYVERPPATGHLLTIPVAA